MFEPTTFNFVRLQDFTLPGGVTVYEYAGHPLVDGTPDFLRINAYLSQDGDFVTVWRGVLEPLCVQSRLGFVVLPADFDFHEYTEELFRGWIDSAEAARHILAALHLDAEQPHVLRTGADGELRCDQLS